MRADEEANENAKERDTRFRGNLKAGLLAGSAAAKVIPFLSSYIPADLAMKGISSISPKLGDFLRKGQSMGLEIKGGLDYLKEQLSGSENSEKKAQENRNIIEKYSPELHQFITEHLKNGRTLHQAGALAQLEGKHSNAIKKIEKDHKLPWSAILESIYGNQSPAQSSQPPAQATPAAAPSNVQNNLQSRMAASRLAKASNSTGAAQQQPQQAQQGNPGLDRLAAAIEKFNQLKTGP
jgi:hypothetical protein